MTSTITSSSSLPPKIVSSSSSTNNSSSSLLTKNSSSLSNNSSSLSNNSLSTTINNQLVKMTTSSNSNERKLFNNNFSPKKEMIDNSTNSNQSNVSNVSTNSTALNGLPPPTSSNNGPNSSSSTSSSPHPLNTGVSNGTNGSNSDLGPSGGLVVPPGSTFPGLSPASAAEMMSRVAASAGWPYNPSAVPPPGWPYNPATMAKSPFLLPPFLSLPPDQLAAMGQPLPASTGPDGPPPPPIPGLPTGPMDMKDLEAAWSGLPYPPSAYYPYDGSLPGYFPNGCVSMYGMDLNGARRKNATRETTSTLKAWLSDHRKNPYPTKGEKIMLAIITKMTLTQVSTWFANARRRLKKENKMTWSPRNRCDDDDDDDRDDDRDGGNNSDPDTDQDRDDSHSLSGRRSTDSPSSTPAHQHHQRHLTRVKRDEGDSEILDIEGDDEDDDHDSHNQNHHHHPSPLHPRMNRLFHHLGPIEKGKDTCLSPLCPCNQQHSHLLNSQHSKLFPNLSTTPNNNSIPNTSSLGGQGLQIPSSQHSQGVLPPSSQHSQGVLPPSSQHSQGVLPPNSHLPPPPHPGSHSLMYCSPFATHSPMGNHHPSSASHLLPGHQRTQVKRVWRVWEK